jgi:hypothetical protein
MHTDDRHPEIPPVLPAILGRQAETIEAGIISELSRLGQEVFPVITRETLVLPIGARILAPMVEEPLVIVGGL